MCTYGAPTMQHDCALALGIHSSAAMHAYVMTLDTVRHDGGRSACIPACIPDD